MVRSALAAMRVWRNGSASLFQSDGAGSIPATRTTHHSSVSGVFLVIVAKLLL